VAGDLLGALIRDWLTPVLKDHGFRRVGRSYEREGDEVIGVVDVQRSLRETGCERLTVNLGVASKKVFAFANHRTGKRTPIELCHWRVRLGRTMEHAGDAWWELCEAADLERVGSEVSEALVKNGLPALDRMSSNEALRSEWAAGRAPGITELQRLQFLSILLNEASLRPQQQEVVQELKELGQRKGLMGVVSVHLEALGVE
jgi:hypothetical protein